jgi:hypothetical protein
MVVMMHVLVRTGGIGVVFDWLQVATAIVYFAALAEFACLRISIQLCFCHVAAST